MHGNRMAELLDAKRLAGIELLDLTESNPTRAAIQYPPRFLSSLADDRAALYEPEPFGLSSAREAIAQKDGVSPERVFLSSSTSEAYSWIFKLLCDPGDNVLIPRPSYPLFEYLARLESVEARHYSLFYDHGWFIDFHTIERAADERTRALVLVNPNNPTGHFLKRHELEQLLGFGLPVISDEVFRDYILDPAEGSVFSLSGRDEQLIFTLNGLSKAAGLPQLKLAWTIVNGPQDVVQHAMERLEIIADTYLSVGTPVQTAARDLLLICDNVQDQILARLRRNLASLAATGLRVLPVEAGWYAVVQVRDEEELAETLLDKHNVLVQPGYFYDFNRPGYIVLSLLTPADVFQRGLELITLTLSNPSSSDGGTSRAAI